MIFIQSAAGVMDEAVIAEDVPARTGEEVAQMKDKVGLWSGRALC
jgi:hypothetical protein